MYLRSGFDIQWTAPAVGLAITLVFGLLPARHAGAQPLSPLGDRTSASNPVSDVYGLTKSATRYEDFQAISRRCSELLGGEPRQERQEIPSFASGLGGESFGRQGACQCQRIERRGITGTGGSGITEGNGTFRPVDRIASKAVAGVDGTGRHPCPVRRI